MFPDVILCRYREPIRQNESQENRFDVFLALAPEIDETSPMGLDLVTLQHWLKKSEVDKTNPKKLHLMTFWHWHQT